MNLPLQPNEGGVSGEAPGVCVGAQGAPGANLCVGSVGFGPYWHDDEPSLRQMYEQACQSIVRLERKLDEAQERIAELERNRSPRLTDEEWGAEKRAEYEADRICGHGWANI